MLSGVDLIGTASIITTIIIGFIGSFGLYWKQQRDQRRKLRKALRSEIESCNIKPYAKAITSEDADFDGWMIPETSPFTSDIYVSNTSKIGLLSDQEIENIVDFYSEAHMAEKEIQRAHGDCETSLANNPFILINRLFELNNQRNDLLKKLDKNLNDQKDRDNLYYVNLDKWNVEKIIAEFGE